MKLKFTENGAKDVHIEVGNRTTRRFDVFCLRLSSFFYLSKNYDVFVTAIVPPFIKLFPSPINRYTHVFA